MLRATVAALCIVSGLAGGCTSYQENTWHFAAAELPAIGKSPVLKFYRIKVKGWSLNGKAEMLEGMYEAAPLHELFGEIKRPEAPEENHEAHTTQTVAGGGAADMPDASHVPVNQPIVQCKAELGELEIVPPDSRFTIFYGANAKALSDVVKQTAEAESTGKGLADLFLAASGGGQEKLAADATEAQANEVAGANTQLSKDVRKQADAVLAFTKPSEAENAIASLAQQALKALGSKTTLDASKPGWADDATAAFTQIEKAGEQ